MKSFYFIKIPHNFLFFIFYFLFFLNNIAINDGKIVWESLVKRDNSLVVTKVIAQNVSPDGKKNLPWLVTKATVCILNL